MITRRHGARVTKLPTAGATCAGRNVWRIRERRLRDPGDQGDAAGPLTGREPNELLVSDSYRAPRSPRRSSRAHRRSTWTTDLTSASSSKRCSARGQRHAAGCDPGDVRAVGEKAADAFVQHGEGEPPMSRSSSSRSRTVRHATQHAHRLFPHSVHLSSAQIELRLLGLQSVFNLNDPELPEAFPSFESNDAELPEAFPSLESNDAELPVAFLHSRRSIRTSSAVSFIQVDLCKAPRVPPSREWIDSGLPAACRRPTRPCPALRRHVTPLTQADSQRCHSFSCHARAARLRVVKRREQCRCSGVRE